MAANPETFRRPAAVRVKHIALPTEHGGWGLLLEPLVAGLAIAFSASGAWIALMFVGAFLMRQPFKIYVLDRRGMRNDARAAITLRYLLMYATVLVAGMVGTAFTSSLKPLLPLIAVLPLAALQNYYDIFRRSRHLVSELAGAVAISSSSAAISLAGGRSTSLSVALWIVFAIRIIPSILYVRERLLLEKGKSFSAVRSNVAHALALVIVSTLAMSGLVTVLSVPVIIFMLYRSITGLSLQRTKLKAMQIGVREVIYGAALVFAVVMARLAGI
jgi:YwiC-like protein